MTTKASPNSKLLRVNRFALVLLSVSTGAVKIAGMEQEMLIFRTAGFPDGLIALFGVLQLAFGLLVLAPAITRTAGLLLAATFMVATAALFVNGLYAFGVFSVLFIAMAMFHGLRWVKN